MADEELLVLNKIKKELLTEANKLLEKLKKQEDEEQIVTLKLLPNVTNNVEEKLSEQYQHRLCEVSRQVSGITFENIDRNWLHDNIYQYTMYIATKALKFHVELTVKLEGETKFEISDITCHFINIDKCYMLEIEPWVQNLTRIKNFSLFTSAISQYNEQSMVRKKILDNLKVRSYVNCEPCTNENGGILIRIHSPQNKQVVYLIFQWSLLFLEQTWQIEHYFVINPDEAGIKFAEDNKSLLEKFCKASITKQTLIDLWRELCSAVNIYEDKDKSKTDCSFE